MLETFQRLNNKAILRIVRHPESKTDIATMDLVKGILYDQIYSVFQISASWSIFTKGGSFADAENIIKGKVASLRTPADEEVWALCLRVRDPSYNRRQWVYHIGLRAQNEQSVQLYYAKTSCEHMAGSISVMRPVPNERDAFLDPLFFDEHVQCMCGESPLPMEPIELTHTALPDLISLIQDEARSIPIILITCAWYLSPEILCDRMLGNAIIYWCENSSVVMRLNAILPRDMYTNWESVRIFHPLAGNRVFHPQYTLDAVRNLGCSSFLDGLMQAYCQSLRSEDQRNFITVDDISRLRDKCCIDRLVTQANERNAELIRVQKQCEALTETNTKISEELEQTAASLKTNDQEELESLLDETMRETDALKKGIRALSLRLYSNPGKEFQPDSSEPIALLQELAQAIQICLSCSGKKSCHSES